MTISRGTSGVAGVSTKDGRSLEDVVGLSKVESRLWGCLWVEGGGVLLPLNLSPFFFTLPFLVGVEGVGGLDDLLGVTDVGMDSTGGVEGLETFEGVVGGGFLGLPILFFFFSFSFPKIAKILEIT